MPPNNVLGMTLYTFSDLIDFSLLDDVVGVGSREACGLEQVHNFRSKKSDKFH